LLGEGAFWWGTRLLHASVASNNNGWEFEVMSPKSHHWIRFYCHLCLNFRASNGERQVYESVGSEGVWHSGPGVRASAIANERDRTVAAFLVP